MASSERDNMRPTERTTVPNHVACIMDGNGRWAAKRRLDRTKGHDAGEDAISAAVEFALSRGIPWLTLFSFSTENWSRPQHEVAFLMEFALRVIANHGADYARRGIRIRYLGRQDRRVPAPVREAMLDIQARTADNSGLNLTFAFNYGGRAEIVDACRRLIDEGTAAEEVDEAIFRESMQFPELPDPDLIIRTGGEYRISNFLLWGAAYAELIFLDVLWPDFRDSDFAEALRWYATRARRFGAVPPAQDHA